MSIFYYQASSGQVDVTQPEGMIILLCLAGALLCWSVFCSWAKKPAGDKEKYHGKCTMQLKN